MRIQCNVCEAAEAVVLCCADEAALCWACDEKVHAANKLASKHQRVSLSSSSSSQIPKCDICQMSALLLLESIFLEFHLLIGSIWVFLCLQDRALLCRKCDVAIHTANPYVSGHQRFLLTGVKVGLETTTDPGASSFDVKSPSSEKTSETKTNSISRRGAPMAFTGGYNVNEVLPSNIGYENSELTKLTYAGGSTPGNIQTWQMDDYLGWLTSIKAMADSGKNGDSDSSSILRSADDELDDDERLGQVPDSSWAVPHMPSPPTASGMYWPKDSRNQCDSVVYVPDICCSVLKNPFSLRRTGSIPKRRRHI
ncbi:B-box zinc finger protein 25 [Hibiscus syriacus]|uniref:B-box zinc finger protein 25 n=1 Tax=Hibiscus syriacus TaxID=106335 RepID=A0A6A3B740_HIBSY|nr:B-box zinc finger protein 25 [Hibiscus syriacus]